jgi:hypothetical protein
MLSESDNADTLGVKHTIRIRDLRVRFGDPEVYAAECSCGWRGSDQSSSTAQRAARRDGAKHLDREQGLPTAPRRRIR